jgi:hypothetical protein
VARPTPRVPGGPRGRVAGRAGGTLGMCVHTNRYTGEHMGSPLRDNLSTTASGGPPLLSRRGAGNVGCFLFREIKKAETKRVSLPGVYNNNCNGAVEGYFSVAMTCNFTSIFPFVALE